MRKLAIIIFLLTTHIQADEGVFQRFEEEIASYDGRILNVPLVEFNGQYFPDVDIMLREDGTWSLDRVGGKQAPFEEIPTPLKVITRQPDDDLNFLAIARIGVLEGGCQAVVVLPQRLVSNNMIILETVRIDDFPSENEGCIGTLVTNERTIVLDTNELPPGTYTVKYRDQTDEFIRPQFWLRTSR